MSQMREIGVLNQWRANALLAVLLATASRFAVASYCGEAGISKSKGPVARMRNIACNQDGKGPGSVGPGPFKDIGWSEPGPILSASLRA